MGNALFNTILRASRFFRTTQSKYVTMTGNLERHNVFLEETEYSIQKPNRSLFPGEPLIVEKDKIRFSVLFVFENKILWRAPKKTKDLDCYSIYNDL